MTLTQLRTFLRAMVPGAKPSVINNTILDLSLNEGVKDIASYTLCLKANKKFTVTAEDQTYNISTVIGDYLGVDAPGLWWDDGTNWKKLYPRTLKWLDENTPNWRSLDSSRPLNYAIDADVITIEPKPDTTLAEGFWLYYGGKPTSMTDDSHYPWSGSATEYSHLSIFDIAIVKYAAWLIQPMLSKDEQSLTALQEYKNEREEKKIIFYKRADIAADPDARLSGPRVG